MKIKLRVVNKGQALNVGFGKGVQLASGTHEYTLLKPLADEVVKTCSALPELEAQLVQQPIEIDPSTVDGVQELQGKVVELEALVESTSKDLALRDNEVAELKKANSELQAKLDASKDAEEEVTEEVTKEEPPAKKTTKRQTAKTETKE